MKLTKILPLLLTTLALLGLSLYWFSIRPAQLREFCTEKAFELVKVSDAESRSEWNWTYSACLHKRGIEK